MAKEENHDEAQGSEENSLRIACLEPSATAICVALGLRSSIVAITHECHEIIGHGALSDIRIATENGLPPTAGQREIHEAVTATSKAAAEVLAKEGVQLTCSPPDQTPHSKISKFNGNDSGRSDVESIPYNSVPSLYPLLPDQLAAARPNIIFTQDLCSVCAPTTTDVRRLLKGRSEGEGAREVTIVSLQPTTLHDVAETFLTVGKACGIPEKGLELKENFLNKLQELKSAITNANESKKSKIPSMFILEWLDPPFDGGHWTRQMMEYACVVPAGGKKPSPKSAERTWEEVHQANADVLVVGCCGFDLKRNLADAWSNKVNCQRSAKRIYACDGNKFIAQPGPDLLSGTAILARCAYGDCPEVVEAIERLDLLPKEASDSWSEVDFSGRAPEDSSSKELNSSIAMDFGNTPIVDVEDLVTGMVNEDGGFEPLHREACAQQKATYTDPETGYRVFTAYAHQQRGSCCGSGCRHCPYGHENVKTDRKAKKIQQPAVLYRASSSSLFAHLSDKTRTKILFFSGGKDSYLTLRALVREQERCDEGDKFGLVLMTTFDATTRVVALQNLAMDDIILRQAQHLDVSLVAVPLRRGSGEAYADRISQGLEVVQKQLLAECNSKISALVFGDLHLQHIKDWRDKSLCDLGVLGAYQLEYPLWKVPYETLLEDLIERSGVPCVISASTVDGVQVGEQFTRSFYARVIDSLSLDGFGERGEFHSVAKVWEVPQKRALGIGS